MSGNKKQLFEIDLQMEGGSKKIHKILEMFRNRNFLFIGFGPLQATFAEDIFSFKELLYEKSTPQRNCYTG